jgi:hypothetical protein
MMNLDDTIDWCYEHPELQSSPKMQHYETKRQILVKLRTLLLERKSFRTNREPYHLHLYQNETLFNQSVIALQRLCP